ncbi:hypothetical protein V8B97DRAFT_1914788 [Scleroderma yunnanense]
MQSYHGQRLPSSTLLSTNKERSFSADDVSSQGCLLSRWIGSMEVGGLSGSSANSSTAFDCSMYAFSSHQSTQAPFFNDSANVMPFSHLHTGSQVGTYHGHDSSTPLSMHTLSCSGPNMPMDELQLYGSSQGFQGQVDTYWHHSSFSNVNNDSMIESLLGLHTMVQQILAEEEMIIALKESNNQLTEKCKAMEKELEGIKTDNRKGKGPKEGSNDHAALKPKCIQALANLLRLENGELYEILEDGCKIWHLNWLGPVDEEINTKFIKEVTDRVWDNKNIPNKDFSLETIKNSAKIYFCTVHKKALGAKDKVKALEWDTTLRCCAHCQASARVHCKAVIVYKGQGHPGASALIDTDWCSEILSYSEEELSDNSKLCRTRAGVGITANMAVGYKWRSLDYVAFLHFLSLWSKGLDSVGNPTEGDNQNIVGPSQGPPKKCHRTTKKLAKRHSTLNLLKWATKFHLAKNLSPSDSWLIQCG